MPAATVTIPGVELVKAGTWRPGSHPQGLTITPAQLADAVKAAGDAEVDGSPIKIGHRGELAELGDGAPAFGWVRNLRLSDDGSTLIGDLADVPAKLAAIIPKAWPKRSAELAFGLRTVGGKLYSMALTGLALLGASAPAVKGLGDIADLYNLNGEPDAEELLELDIDGALAGPATALLAATAAVLELELGDDKADALIAALAAAATIPANPTGPRQNDANPPPSPTRETETMDDAKLRSILKLADDADLEAELAKITAAAEAAETPPAEETPPATPPAPAAEERELEPAGLSAATLEDLKAAGLTVVDAASLSELTTASDELKTARLSGIVDDAVRAGKIAPAEAAAYFTPAKDGKPASGLLLTDEPGATALLAASAARFPTAELGDAAALELEGPDADAAVEKFIASLPGVRG